MLDDRDKQFLETLERAMAHMSLEQKDQIHNCVHAIVNQIFEEGGVQGDDQE